MNSVVMVPGLRDSGPQHWQTLWQARLPHVTRVQQQDWQVADLQRWSDNIVAAVQAQGTSWIVAHSFGCLASVHALARIRDQVHGLLLVAPADPDKFGIAELLPADALAVPGLLVASGNDPWLAQARAEQWAQRWQLPTHCAGLVGHINAESGHGHWPSGWQLFEQLCNSTPPLPSQQQATLRLAI